MCGRYRYEEPWSVVHAALTEFVGPVGQAPLNLEPREQIRPTQHAPIVTISDKGPLVWNARWWFVPFFHRGALKDWKATTFNARAETVVTSRAYRDAFHKRRCLVVADAWYEWMGAREDGSGKKQPYLLRPKASEPIMFAGIWDRCETTDQGVVESCSIVTRPAGSDLAMYHDRAPVVLFADQWAKWLAPDADHAALLQKQPAGMFTVEKAVI
jgi:putative SOS response-associated peptidase YedK